MKGQLIRKDPDAGKDGRKKEKGAAKDEIFRWHHRLKGHELEQTLGDSRGEKSLVCCSPWVAESDTTEGLNDNTEDQQGQVMCPRMSNIRVSAPLDEEARGCSMHSARKGL